MAIFDDERPGRAAKTLAAIAASSVALLLAALFALPATATATDTPAAPAPVAVGSEDPDDPGGECCSRGTT